MDKFCVVINGDVVYWSAYVKQFREERPKFVFVKIETVGRQYIWLIRFTLSC